MKKYILSILTIIFLSNLSFGQIQSGEVTYKVKDPGNFKTFIDTVNANPSQKDALKSWFFGLKKALPGLSFNLEFNKKQSLFKAEKFLANDNGIDLNRATKYVGGSGIFYTDIEKNLKLHQLNYINKDWLIKCKIDGIKWHITNETEVIQGYVCKKATTIFGYTHVRKGKVTAWFCPELPFQFGPMNYAGLPGLILGLEHHYWYFYADKIKLSKKSKTIKKPTKGKLITQEEYSKETNTLAKKMKRRVAGE